METIGFSTFALYVGWTVKQTMKNDNNKPACMYACRLHVGEQERLRERKRGTRK